MAAVQEEAALGEGRLQEKKDRPGEGRLQEKGSIPFFPLRENINPKPYPTV